jgi:L1 cell adhesion molecule like protein
MKHWPFKLINHSGKPIIGIEYKKQIKFFTPEQISSMILTKMKQIAEDYLGQNVLDVVITVPALFNHSESFSFVYISFDQISMICPPIANKTT